MPEYLSPGVYIEEINSGNEPIEGVSTSTVGFLGVTERGPQTPTLIGSFTEYQRTFGTYVKKDPATGKLRDLFTAYGVEGFFTNGGKRCFVMRVQAQDGAAANATVGGIPVNASGKGLWGNRIAVKVDKGSLFQAAVAAVPAAGGAAAVPASPGNLVYKLTVMYWSSDVTVPGIDDNTPANLVDPTDLTKRSDPNRREPAVVEIYDNLSADIASYEYYPSAINTVSNLISVDPGAAALATAALTLLSKGTEGAKLEIKDFKGEEVFPGGGLGVKTGLLAFEEVQEISIVCCPDEHWLGDADTTISQELVSHCERLMSRVAILQAIQHPGKSGTHFPTLPSKYAAYYFPWLNVTSPLLGTPLEIPPGGHLAGIYARSDNTRGVHKAPANEPILGVDSLQVQVTTADQDILNPRGVNVLRAFPGRGNLVWGARTTTLDTQWRYLNVRRLFIYIEQSIEQSTHWVVFEPNDAPLWAQVKRAVSDFLTRAWMDGMLQGQTKEEAFFVKCDRTTMTQLDIDLGRLIVVIGIAPVKPAEFVIFRIGQSAGGSTVTEG